MKGYVGIKTPEPHTVEELYELMKREGKFALPYEIHGKGIMQAIWFPLRGNDAMQIAVRKKSIGLSITKMDKVKDLAIWALTDQWSSVFDTSARDNHDLLEETAVEIRRITGGK